MEPRLLHHLSSSVSQHSGKGLARLVSTENRFLWVGGGECFNSLIDAFFCHHAACFFRFSPLREVLSGSGCLIPLA